MAAASGQRQNQTDGVRRMEALLHAGSKTGGWCTAPVPQTILTRFGLKAKEYTQLRYDLRQSAMGNDTPIA